MASSRALMIFGVLGLGLAAGCPFSFANEEHCANNDGDSTCAAANPDTPYCALDNCGEYDEVTNRTGCVAAIPEKMECYSPCGGALDATERSECDLASGTDTDADTDPSASSTTAGPTSTSESTTDPGCECTEDAPICLDGECVACDGDGFCDAAFGEDRGLCEAGDCVQCRPELAELGVRHEGCDFTNLNCVGGTCNPVCLFPDDCPESGCELREGFCVPRERFFYVSVGGDDDGPGTADAPFGTIQRAVDAVGRQTEAQPYQVGTILLGAGTYEEAVVVESRAVAVRPADLEGERPVVRAPAVAEGVDPEPAFRLIRGAADSLGGGTMSIMGVSLSGSPGAAVFVGSTARLYADDVEFIGNGVAVDMDGAGGFLRNCIVAEQVEGVFMFRDVSELALVSTTVIDEREVAEGETLATFDCTGDAENTQLSIRDSIVGSIENAEAPIATMEGCVEIDGEPQRSLVGFVGPEGAYQTGYRLDANPGEAFELNEDVGACAPGAPIDPEGFFLPCPPSRDIDGDSREGQNYKGASVP